MSKVREWEFKPCLLVLSNDIERLYHTKPFWLHESWICGYVHTSVSLVYVSRGTKGSILEIGDAQPLEVSMLKLPFHSLILPSNKGFHFERGSDHDAIEEANQSARSEGEGCGCRRCRECHVYIRSGSTIMARP